MAKAYHVLDSRGPFMVINGDDWEVSIMYTGPPLDCCNVCNAGTYGTGCVVCDEDGEIKWDWYTEQHDWTPFL